MDLLKEIIQELPEGKISAYHAGVHWTCVVADVNGDRRAGLASNPFDLALAPADRAELDLRLKTGSVKELCSLVFRHDVHLASVGMAAINALLPQFPETWTSQNASDVIAEKGEGKRVALVGHFPFVPEIKNRVGHLDILELQPQEGDLNASETPRILPQADVVAITSMTFVNGTFDHLLELCRPDACVIVLGPSTPLSPRLFEHGVGVLCGSIVTQVESVVEAIEKGMHFRAIHPRGVRLVTVFNGR